MGIPTLPSKKGEESLLRPVIEMFCLKRDQSTQEFDSLFPPPLDSGLVLQVTLPSLLRGLPVCPLLKHDIITREWLANTVGGQQECRACSVPEEITAPALEYCEKKKKKSIYILRKSSQCTQINLRNARQLNCSTVKPVNHTLNVWFFLACFICLLTLGFVSVLSVSATLR